MKLNIKNFARLNAYSLVLYGFGLGLIVASIAMGLSS
jgi:hypothetical protein